MIFGILFSILIIGSTVFVIGKGIRSIVKYEKARNKLLITLESLNSGDDEE